MEGFRGDSHIFLISIHNSLLTFADDTKCFGPVTNCTDEQLLQHDINLLFHWSSRSCLCLNPIKCVHISFRANRITSYRLNKHAIPKLNSHRDLGVIIYDCSSWRNHYTYEIILSKVYKTLSHIHHTFKSSHSLSINKVVHDPCSFYIDILFTCVVAIPFK